MSQEQAENWWKWAFWPSGHIRTELPGKWTVHLWTCFTCACCLCCWVPFSHLLKKNDKKDPAFEFLITVCFCFTIFWALWKALCPHQYSHYGCMKPFHWIRLGSTPAQRGHCIVSVELEWMLICACVNFEFVDISWLVCSMSVIQCSSRGTYNPGSL